MYQCHAMNTILSIAKSKTRFMDVSNFGEDEHIDMRPDLALYPTDITNARMAYSFTKDEKKRSMVSDVRKPYIARCAWGWMMVFVH